MNARAFMATTDGGLARAWRLSSGKWQVEQQLFGKKVNCLSAHPSVSGAVFAGTSSGVLRSDDSGKSWRPAGLKGLAVKAMGTSPAHPATIYAGGKPPFLYVSRDDGGTWKELPALQRMRQWWWFTPAEPGPEYVQAIAVSPDDPKILLVGIKFGAVLHSADGGQSWSKHRKGALRDCHSMTFHSIHRDWVYEAGGSGGGTAYSRDGGRVWHKHSEGLDRKYGWACAADPGDPSTWYASLAPGPYKAHGDGKADAAIYRTRAGRPWERLAGGLPRPLTSMPYALLTDPQAPGHLYAGLSHGEIWHTGDYGERWEKLPLNLGGIHRSLIMLRE